MQLVAALQTPEAYPHPTGAIELRETHISWVVLTGEFAYKIKKPVSLGFLDFSTLEKRRHCCEEELRLNRRYSPDLYLEVVPITGTPEAPRVDGEGPPIEFAVKMRQFPEEALLSRVLQRQALEPQHVDALALAVAEFHAEAAVAPQNSRFGTPESVWRPIAENFTHLKRSKEAPEAVERLWSWSQREWEACRDVFAARKRDGFVRECHGDLHVGNVLLLNDRIRMFDCIEFNEDFRWIDVLSDIAFTVMDFADFGRRDYAHRLLNSYLQQTGDYAGLAVWRFYLVYRALVRAKVAVIRAGQPGIQPEDSAAAIAAFRGYVQLAEDFIRAERPQLVITHGFSGSGKTSLTQPLLEAIGAVRIRSDIERRRADNSTHTGGLNAGRYAPEMRQRNYERLADLTAAALRGGMPVIVDATFLMRSQRRRFRELADQCAVPFVILSFQARPDELRRRVAHRHAQKSDASEADVAVLEDQFRTAEPLDSSERPFTIEIDTEAEHPLKTAVERLAPQSGR